jgi:hypothetical protein
MVLFDLVAAGARDYWGCIHFDRICGYEAGDWYPRVGGDTPQEQKDLKRDEVMKMGKWEDLLLR